MSLTPPPPSESSVFICQLEQGETLVQSVVAMGDDAGDFLPRAHLAIGLCYSLRATEGDGGAGGAARGGVWVAKGCQNLLVINSMRKLTINGNFSQKQR